MNLGFLVLCLARSIPAVAPNGPSRALRRSVDSLVLYWSFCALCLSHTNMQNARTFSSMYSINRNDVDITHSLEMNSSTSTGNPHSLTSSAFLLKKTTSGSPSESAIAFASCSAFSPTFLVSTNR